ncbi:DUF2946 family protein [Stenotrophomonas sp. NPDC077659]|uniref:DUF2946 family protein n=1 Tax=Stenotrophomonas sp. NPDC077659 TaxID=3390694 RepID=UPI003D065983
MLLVLLAPLVSRWMAHGPVPAAAPVMAPMDHSGHAEHAQHAMEGHHDHHAMAMAHEDAASTPAVDPHAGHDMGVDCEYCLIAARLITLLVAVLLLLVLLLPVCRARSGTLLALPVRLVGTLGARGPPGVLAG